MAHEDTLRAKAAIVRVADAESPTWELEGTRLTDTRHLPPFAPVQET